MDKVPFKDIVACFAFSLYIASAVTYMLHEIFGNDIMVSCYAYRIGI